MSKRALDLGHVRVGQEVNRAEVVEVENAGTQDCEFISDKMSQAQRKDLCKELEKHSCLWETCGPEYKNKSRRSRALGPVPRKMVKFNPGLSQISSMVFSSKNMQLEVTIYCLVFITR